MSPRFNPPPNWPEPPHDGWVPPEGFQPPYTWGPVPSGWRLWIDDEADAAKGSPANVPQAPLQRSEDVPASGARPRPRIETYPVAVINPGMWSQNHLEDEDYGFGPATPRRDRPRLRLAMTITATALGFALAAAVAVGFVQLTDFAIEDLPGMVTGAGSHLAGADGVAGRS
ncbi:hypothetical protein ACXET9_04995 [Brachybacterium sp. DNPG3]